MVVAESFRAFFERYASLSTGPNPEQLAALYDESFLVAAPKGSAAFRNDAAFHEWLRQVHDFNAQTGMTSLAPVELDVVSVGPQFVLVTVRWAATFRKTGEAPIHFRISYLLRASGETYRVAGYVSHEDEEAVRRAHGLLWRSDSLIRRSGWITRRSA